MLEIGTIYDCDRAIIGFKQYRVRVSTDYMQCIIYCYVEWQQLNAEAFCII